MSKNIWNHHPSTLVTNIFESENTCWIWVVTSNTIENQWICLKYLWVVLSYLHFRDLLLWFPNFKFLLTTRRPQPWPLINNSTWRLPPGPVTTSVTQKWELRSPPSAGKQQGKGRFLPTRKRWCSIHFAGYHPFFRCIWGFRGPFSKGTSIFKGFCC